MPDVDFLNERQGGFYFGLGGLGDAILLLSSFYPQSPSHHVIFWPAASSPALLQEFFDCFPLLLSVSTPPPPQSFDQRARVAEYFFQHPNFLGAAHTPRYLDYIVEWTKRPHVYRRALPRRWPELREMFSPITATGGAKRIVGVGGWGSNVNVAHKNRRLSQEELVALCSVLLKRKETPCIFGSLVDKERFVLPQEIAHDVIDVRGKPLRTSLSWLNTCSSLISVDTWYLQWARLVKLPTTVIQTRYDAPPEFLFGGAPTDPSDRIFVEGWGFNVVPLERLLNAA